MAERRASLDLHGACVPDDQLHLVRARESQLCLVRLVVFILHGNCAIRECGDVDSQCMQVDRLVPVADQYDIPEGELIDPADGFCFATPLPSLEDLVDGFADTMHTLAKLLFRPCTKHYDFGKSVVWCGQELHSDVWLSQLDLENLFNQALLGWFLKADSTEVAGKGRYCGKHTESVWVTRH